MSPLKLHSLKCLPGSSYNIGPCYSLILCIAADPDINSEAIQEFVMPISTIWLYRKTFQTSFIYIDMYMLIISFIMRIISDTLMTRIYYANLHDPYTNTMEISGVYWNIWRNLFDLNVYTMFLMTLMLIAECIRSDVVKKWRFSSIDRNCTWFLEANSLPWGFAGVVARYRHSLRLLESFALAMEHS